MRTVRLRDTGPELALRRELYRLGLRYRLHRPIVPGVRRSPDIVFGPLRVAVFVDGCFWHGCPQHGTAARANAAFWKKKLAENERRDRDTDGRLKRAGWRVVRVWEHEEPRVAALRIASALRRTVGEIYPVS
jgi:DNA mismatch endonuclease (patch repair protein)